MSYINDLKQLQELPTPAMPSLWPQTWGWLALCVLVVVLACTAFALWQRRRQANAYRRVAVAELDAITERWRQKPNDTSPLRDIPALLKRAALTRLGHSTPSVGYLSGREWQHLLERMAQTPFTNNFWEHLAVLAYADDLEIKKINIRELITECRDWLETHHDSV